MLRILCNKFLTNRLKSYRTEMVSKQFLTKGGMDEALSLGCRAEILSKQSLTKCGLDKTLSPSCRAENPL